MTESEENEEWTRAIFIQTLHVPTDARTHLHAYLAVCPGPWTSWRVQTRDRWWLVNSLSTSNTRSIRIKFGVSCTMEKIYSLSHSRAVQKFFFKKPSEMETMTCVGEIPGVHCVTGYCWTFSNKLSWTAETYTWQYRDLLETCRSRGFSCCWTRLNGFKKFV